MNHGQLHFPHREMESITELLLFTVSLRKYLNASGVWLGEVQLQFLLFLGVKNKPVRNLGLLSVFPQELLLMLCLKQVVPHLVIRKQLKIK